MRYIHFMAPPQPLKGRENIQPEEDSNQIRTALIHSSRTLLFGRMIIAESFKARG
jgi:hypothetical protein